MSLKRLLMEILEASGLTHSGSLCDIHISLCRLPAPPIRINKKMENVLFEIQQPFNWEIAEKIMNKKIDGDIYWKNESNNELVKQAVRVINPNKPLIYLSNVNRIVDIQDLYCKIRLQEGSDVILQYYDDYDYICRLKELKRASDGSIAFVCVAAINQYGVLFPSPTFSINSDCKNIQMATNQQIRKLNTALFSSQPNIPIAMEGWAISDENTGIVAVDRVYTDSKLESGKIANPADKLLELDKKYLRIAYIWAENSYCTRRKVGAIIVKDKMIISDGYNGTPSGFENVCELDDGTTKSYVLHAEANAITKLAKSHNSSEGATLYVTTSPCMECSKLIIQAGIRRVVYCEEYSHKEGLEILQKAGVEIVQIKELK